MFKCKSVLLNSKIILLLIALCFVFTTSAQFNNTVLYDTYSGLPNNTVHKIYQDYYGFIWFCTAKGISRFDGYTFTPFNATNSGLGNEFVIDMIEDKQHNLWFATNYGLFFMNHKTSTITDFTVFLPQQGDACYINALCLMPDNTIGLATHDGFYRFNIVSKKINKIFFNTKQIPKQTQASCIYLDTRNYLWIGYKEHGLIKWNIKKNNYSYCSIISSVKTIAGNNNYLWIGTDNNGIVKLNINNGKQEQLTQQKNNLGSNAINKILINNNGNILVATEGGGINVLDASKNLFTCYTKNNSGISNDKVWDIFEDNQQNIWLGHFLGGVTYLNMHPKLFNFIGVNTLPYDVVSGIQPDNQTNYWIANDEGGLIKLNREKQKDKTYYNELINLQSDGYDAVISTFKDSKGYIWIGKFRSGISLYNPNTQQIQALNKFIANDIIQHADIRGFAEDKSGNMWIATHGKGLFKVNLLNKTIQQFVSNPQQKTHLTSDWLWQVFVDSKNFVWITSVNGLCKLNPVNNYIDSYLLPNDKNTLRGGNNVISIKEDIYKTLWIGTSGGLYFFKNGQINFKKIELPNYPCSINAIEIDAKNNLWLSTNLGIINFNPTNNLVKLLDKKNEIINTELSNNATAKDSKGYLFFGGNKGILWFHPDSLIQNTIVPCMYVTDLKLFYKSIHPTVPNSPLTLDIIHTNKIVLDHTQRIFSIEFSALNYNQPEKNEYMYQLEGIDKEWIKCGNKRQASYMNLPPGTYTFNVKGSNNNGIWNIVNNNYSSSLVEYMVV